MTPTVLPEAELYTEVIQIIRGGEPDDDGVSLAGRISPLAPSYNTRTCACSCVAMVHSFWELLERYSPYEKDSSLWLRIRLKGDEDEALPEGATLIDSKRVSYLVR